MHAPTSHSGPGPESASTNCGLRRITAPSIRPASWVTPPSAKVLASLLDKLHKGADAWSSRGSGVGADDDSEGRGVMADSDFHLKGAGVQVFI
jgi:hypothetical protein